MFCAPSSTHKNGASPGHGCTLHPSGAGAGPSIFGNGFVRSTGGRFGPAEAVPVGVAVPVTAVGSSTTGVGEGDTPPSTGSVGWAVASTVAVTIVCVGSPLGGTLGVPGVLGAPGVPVAVGAPQATITNVKMIYTSPVPKSLHLDIDYSPLFSFTCGKESQQYCDLCLTH